MMTESPVPCAEPVIIGVIAIINISRVKVKALRIGPRRVITPLQSNPEWFKQLNCRFSTLILLIN